MHLRRRGLVAEMRASLRVSGRRWSKASGRERESWELVAACVGPCCAGMEMREAVPFGVAHELFDNAVGEGIDVGVVIDQESIAISNFITDESAVAKGVNGGGAWTITV